MSGKRRAGPPRSPGRTGPPGNKAAAKPAARARPSPTPSHRRARHSTRIVWWAILAGLVVAGILAVALTAGGSDSSGKLEVAKTVTVDGAALPTFKSPQSDPAVGMHAPTLTGQNFDRQPVTIGGTGAPHVVMFVAHWCPHCQAEVPRVVALERSGGTAGVAVTAVATGTNSSAPNYPPSAWLHSEGWPYPVLVDTASDTAATAYGLSAYPYLVFVDAAGNVAARVTGEVPSSDLSTMFAALAAGKPVSVPSSGASSSG